MTKVATRPAGWYRDPEALGYERYWDGETWSYQRRHTTGPIGTPDPELDRDIPLSGTYGIIAAGLVLVMAPFVVALFGVREAWQVWLAVGGALLIVVGMWYSTPGYRTVAERARYPWRHLWRRRRF